MKEQLLSEMTEMEKTVSDIEEAISSSEQQNNRSWAKD